MQQFPPRPDEKASRSNWKKWAVIGIIGALLGLATLSAVLETSVEIETHARPAATSSPSPMPSPSDSVETAEPIVPVEPVVECVVRRDAMSATKVFMRANKDVGAAAKIPSVPLLVDGFRDGAAGYYELADVLEEGGESAMADDVADVGQLWDSAADAFESGSYARGVKLFAEATSQLTDVADLLTSGDLLFCDEV